MRETRQDFTQELRTSRAHAEDARESLTWRNIDKAGERSSTITAERRRVMCNMRTFRASGSVRAPHSNTQTLDVTKRSTLTRDNSADTPA